jgi:transcriptional regulator
MRENSFATIISASENTPSATHLPFLIEPDQGKFGTLYAHMARANPLWKSWTNQSQALVIFTGPHTYISPAWYKQQETVPTWNYSAVHAYGTPKLIEDPDALRSLVTRQVSIYEAKQGSPWDQSLMANPLKTELKAIVGFTIEITQLEGKFKFNQNRSPEDQSGVVASLQGSKCPFQRAVSSFMSNLKAPKAW